MKIPMVEQKARELTIVHGPDPMVSGKPDDVRVRLVRIDDTIRVTVESSWSWEPYEADLTSPAAPEPPPPADDVQPDVGEYHEAPVLPPRERARPPAYQPAVISAELAPKAVREKLGIVAPRTRVRPPAEEKAAMPHGLRMPGLLHAVDVWAEGASVVDYCRAKGLNRFIVNPLVSEVVSKLGGHRGKGHLGTDPVIVAKWRALTSEDREKMIMAALGQKPGRGRATSSAPAAGA